MRRKTIAPVLTHWVELNERVPGLLAETDMARSELRALLAVARAAEAYFYNSLPINESHLPLRRALARLSLGPDGRSPAHDEKGGGTR